MHPHLSFDLLRSQMDACHEIDVKVPIYLTAGVDNAAAEDHPEWREIDADGKICGWTSSPLDPGFKTLCFNSPYLGYLCAKIEEAVRLFPDADGIFLDIISQSQCCCPHCMKVMEKHNLDPTREVDRLKSAELALMRYYERTTAACKKHDPDMPVFHNSGNIPIGRRKAFPFFSHQELESLPTGGWGYDHFPFMAKYTAGLGSEFLGMTGKFHTTWGEFGGFKHPNALRYECAAMLAFGAKCSIGDQLHPSGKMDPSTYRIIGEAYAEVEEKEPWCRDSSNIAEIALFSITGNRERINGFWDPDNRDHAGETGASRILLEGHFLFDVIDDEMDFSGYRVIILPDDIVVDSYLKEKLDVYITDGGKLFITGESAVDAEGKALFDLGAKLGEVSELSPDFIQPEKEYAPDFLTSPMVMYTRGRRLQVTGGISLGKVYDPYFNRRYDHFCSHQHTPNRPENSGYDCGVLYGQVLYLPHKVFTLYRAYGAVVYKDFIIRALSALMGTAKIRTNLPSTARLVMSSQEAEQRRIIHLLYGNTVTRGGDMELDGGVGGSGHPPKAVEVIEELLPLYNTTLKVATEKPRAVYLEPQHELMEYQWENGKLLLAVKRFSCHQMVVLEYR